MTDKKLEEFLQQYYVSHEVQKKIFFDGDPASSLKVAVSGPKISMMALSPHPVLFFQLLSLRGYKRNDRGTWTNRFLPLEESPMALPELSRKMGDWGWDCEGRGCLPFYYHRESGKGLPGKTTMPGYQWATEISDTPGPAFTEPPVDLYPQWDFTLLTFRTIVTGVDGIDDMSRLPEMKKEESAGLRFLPAYMVEWSVVPPWGKEGFFLWKRILEKLETAFMGGMVYIVKDFDPDEPLKGAGCLSPVQLSPGLRDTVFFEPLRFWRERFTREGN